MSNIATTWLLIGAPNSGKTSLFNRLTGSSADVMNYPGSTVLSHKASLKKEYAKGVVLVDTPGGYSVAGHAPEGIELSKALAENKDSPIIFVMDFRFAKHRLVFLKQLLAQGRKCVAFCTHVGKHTHKLEALHAEYGISFIDGDQVLALKTLVYAMQNIHIQAPLMTGASSQSVCEVPSYVLDRIFLHSWLGLVSAFALMIFIFSSVFYVSMPVSDALDFGIDRLIILLRSTDVGAQHPLAMSLLCGMISGVGSLMVFVPQIFLLFVIVLFIQESGYLARAAVILDPIFQRVGLHGKSFVSLLSGFSCAIPAIMLTKTIDSKKERMLTILAIPFMMCSARVPLFAMGISFLFYDNPILGGVIFGGLYFMSFLMALTAAGAITLFFPSKEISSFMMELPPYKLPPLWSIVRASMRRVAIFLKNAGPLILGISLIVWFATTFPNYDNTNTSERVSESYAAKVGQWVAPVFEPMGLDWKVGTAVIISFSAREVFVPTLTLLLGQDVTETSVANTFEQWRSLKATSGSSLFSRASMVALLVFFMIALQCTSTVAIIAKETNSWRRALLQFVIMNCLAYAFAVMMYKILSGV